MDKFLEDIQTIYDYISATQERYNNYFIITQGKEHKAAKELLERFLKELALQENEESIMASLNYLINLKEDSLIQYMQKEGVSQEEIDKKLESAYKFNAKLYLKRFEALIEFIEANNLLSSFYRALIKGVHSIGEVMTLWQSKWRAHIINGINKELFELFKGDEEKIFQMLEAKSLLDCKKGAIADRCYSVLVNENGSYKRLAYSQAFQTEVTKLIQRLEILIQTLQELEDTIYHQKKEWIAYFQALKEAFLHDEVDELVELWADVDRAWMKITTPLQVGHPLEYYEDKYRKAVALEWDLRIINPSMQKSSSTKENIKTMAKKLAQNFGARAVAIIENNIKQVDNTQLYIGQPAMYYGAELNGLFSAQVVPNDEEVSSELGKKIFAYVDFVRESKKSKPVMQLSLNTFGESFIAKQRQIINKTPELWNKIYDISTIGHEFGHILWIDADTEVVMNKSGQFKNIEEFKATTGGLMAFFENEEEALKEHIVDDVVSRAVSLMAWREVGEVLPYYTEGLIHLELLYHSNIIQIQNNKVTIDYSYYENFKHYYQDAYSKLAKHYLAKKDANEYLMQYTQKKENIFLPRTKELKEFVEHYYSEYKRIGNLVAKEFML